MPHDDKKTQVESEGLTLLEVYVNKEQISESPLFVRIERPMCHPTRVVDELGATKCTACPSGFYNKRAGGECLPCAQGSFSVQKQGDGALECIMCKDLPGSFYQPTTRQDKCLACPPNTENSGSSGTDVNECVCKPGFWRPDGRRGAPCVLCPVLFCNYSRMMHRNTCSKNNVSHEFPNV